MFLQRLVVALSLAMLVSVGRDSTLASGDLSGTTRSANAAVVGANASSGESRGANALSSRGLVASVGVFLPRVPNVVMGRVARAPWQSIRLAHGFEAAERPRIREAQRVHLSFGDFVVASQSGRLSVHAQQLPPPVRA